MRNNRASKMWFYIFGHVTFDDKQVLDLGCGYGDFMTLSLEAGADFVLGVERDMGNAALADGNIQAAGYDVDRYGIVIDDIDRIVENNDTVFVGYDIIICTSVLPYLVNPEEALRWMRDSGDITIIECQYSNDGPGLENIHNDKEMRAYLKRAGWKNVNRIGSTDVKIRPASRTIWKCYD